MKEILLPIVLCFLILGCVLTHSSLQDKTTEKKLEKYSEEVIAKCTCAERYLAPITALLRETEARNTILEENLVIERGITAGLQAAEVSLESAIEERGIRLKEVESELVRLSQEKLLAVDYEKIIDNLNATINLLAAEKEDISAKLQEKQEEVNQLLVEKAKMLATDKILTEEMNVIQNQLYWKKLLVFCLEIMAIAESLLCVSNDLLHSVKNDTDISWLLQFFY